jgi:hypothetical protein
MVYALAGSEFGDDTMDMIDSAIIRARHQAADGKGGFRATLSAVLAATSQLKPCPLDCSEAS